MMNELVHCQEERCIGKSVHQRPRENQTEILNPKAQEGQLSISRKMEECPPPKLVRYWEIQLANNIDSAKFNPFLLIMKECLYPCFTKNEGHGICLRDFGVSQEISLEQLES